MATIQKKEVFSQNLSVVKLNTLIATTPHRDVSEKLKVISEMLRFSDYHSYPELEDLDSDIRKTMRDIQMNINDLGASLALTKKLEILVKERCETCKYLRKVK